MLNTVQYCGYEFTKILPQSSGVLVDTEKKMHQIRFRLAGGANSAPPDPVAGLKGPGQLSITAH